MKFIELKSSLKKKIENIYLLQGEDRFVVYSALELIEKAINLNFKEINTNIFQSDSKYTLKEVTDSAMVFPFGDERRLIVVWEYSGKDFEVLEEFAKENTTAIVVFVNYNANDFTKKLLKLASFVDCGKLDDITIKKWIVATLSKSKVKIQADALDLFVNYCNNNMVKVCSETEKLSSVGNEVIDVNLIKKYVVPDKEYQIYEITDAIAKNNKQKVFEIVNNMQEHDKNAIGLLQYLYSSFRRLLLIKLSTKTDEELAADFKIKPYAVKMARLQSIKFSAKQLKQINEILSKLDSGIKLGITNQQIAVQFALTQILNIIV